MRQFKQHITIKQRNGLDEKSKIKWLQYSIKHGFYDIEATIGQIIEYLGDDLHGMNVTDKEGGGEGWWVIYGDVEFNAYELCDALFEAVKYKLKQ